MPARTFLIGVAGGFAAGVVTGLLIAPESGDDLRNRVSYQTSKVVEDLEDFFRPLTKEAAVVRPRPRNLRHKDRESASQLMNEVDDIINRLKTEEA